MDEIGAGPKLLDRPGVVRAFLDATARGFHAARTDQAGALELLERVTPYFPNAVLARSLELVAPTRFHEGRWGGIREELMQPYAEWLSRHGILPAGAPWRDAVAAELVSSW